MKCSNFTRDEVSKSAKLDQRIIDFEVDDGTDGRISSAVRSSRFSTAHAVVEGLMVGSRSTSHLTSINSLPAVESPNTYSNADGADSEISPISDNTAAADSKVLVTRTIANSLHNNTQPSSTELTPGSSDAEPVSSESERVEKLTVIPLSGVEKKLEFPDDDIQSNIHEREKTDEIFDKPEIDESIELISGRHNQRTGSPRSVKKTNTNDLKPGDSFTDEIYSRVSVKDAVEKLEKKIKSGERAKSLSANDITVSSITKSMPTKSTHMPMLEEDKIEASIESTPNSSVNYIYANSEANEDTGLHNVPLQDYSESCAGDFSINGDPNRLRRTLRGVRAFLRQKPTLPKRWPIFRRFKRGACVRNGNENSVPEGEESLPHNVSQS